MKADVFRPQSVGRAVRTAFVLGVLVVIAIVAAVGAFGNFNALVGDNTKDELGRYLDDNAALHHQAEGRRLHARLPGSRRRASRSGSPPMAARSTPRATAAVVDDEITFDVVWFDLAAVPTNVNKTLSSMITRQVRQLSATKVAVGTMKRVGKGHGRDFVAVNVDQNGLKRYYDERDPAEGPERVDRAGRITRAARCGLPAVRRVVRIHELKHAGLRCRHADP